MLADSRPLRRVPWRTGYVLGRTVVGRLAETVEHLRSGVRDGLEIGVRPDEVVGGGIVGVGVEIRKHGGDVNDVRRAVGEAVVRVMDAGEGDAGGAISLEVVGFLRRPRPLGAVVDRVHGADRAERRRWIDGHARDACLVGVLHGGGLHGEVLAKPRSAFADGVKFI